MSYYFDNNSRYQIIYPYTSDKIHVEPSIDHGAYRCYQEIKDREIITYIFIVHDIDAGTLYYFNIPKNKHLEATQNPQPITNTGMNPSPGMKQVPSSNLDPFVQHQAPTHQTSQSIPQMNQPTTQSTMQSTMQSAVQPLVQPTHQPMQSINIINPANPTVPLIGAAPTDYSIAKQNEIITRLNHVEYQLDRLKRKVQSEPKKEEDGCVIM